MKRDDKESMKFAVSVVNDITSDLQQKIDLNDRTIEHRKISSAASLTLASDVLRVSKMIKDLLEDNDLDHSDRVEKALEVVSALNGSLESLPQAEREEIIRLEANQEGMRRVIEVVRSAAAEKLAQQTQVNQEQKVYDTQDLDWDDT
jgi:hypothetical protein